MHMTKLKKLGAGLLVIAFAASCSIATSMDATIDREIEAATKAKGRFQNPYGTVE